MHLSPTRRGTRPLVCCTWAVWVCARHSLYSWQLSWAAATRPALSVAACCRPDIHLQSARRPFLGKLARELFQTSWNSPADLDLYTAGQHTLQLVIDSTRHLALRESASVRDQARLTATSASHAGAWLRALPVPSLGLTMSRHEIVLALHLCLGIPIFPPPPEALRCSCRQVIDVFGDHMLGCGHCPLRSRRHDVLREIIFYALLNDHPGVRRE